MSDENRLSCLLDQLLMMSSLELSIEDKMSLCAYYMPTACKDVVKHYMEKKMIKRTHSCYPIGINGIIVILVDIFYYQIFAKIVSIIITPSITITPQKLLTDVNCLLTQENEWNAYVMKCIGM